MASTPAHLTLLPLSWGVKDRRPLNPLTLDRRSSFLGLDSEAETGRDMF